MTFITRFAPSPTGPLHLGHAYSAMLTHDMARQHNGRFLLRIEDLDRSRSRPEWILQIQQDLKWLGLEWDEPLICQSTRTEKYQSALKTLWNQGLLYQCHCSRADIKNAISAPQEGVSLHGPDGIIYPGTCRPDEPPAGEMPTGVLRLDVARAFATLSEPLEFEESGTPVGGQESIVEVGNMIEQVGDIVLCRKDMAASYHLAVVVDDAAQNISHVVRGQDLFEVTQIHVLLQKLLSLPTPVYHHHLLVRDAAGKRLAKRDNARAIAKYRYEGYSPQDIRVQLKL